MTRPRTFALLVTALALTATPALASRGSDWEKQPTRPHVHVSSAYGCDWARQTVYLESDEPTEGRIGVRLTVDGVSQVVTWLSVGERFSTVTVKRAWRHDEAYTDHYIATYVNHADGTWQLKREVRTHESACP